MVQLTTPKYSAITTPYASKTASTCASTTMETKSPASAPSPALEIRIARAVMYANTQTTTSIAASASTRDFRVGTILIAATTV